MASSEPFYPDEEQFLGSPVSELFAKLREGTPDEKENAAVGLSLVYRGCTSVVMHSRPGLARAEIAPAVAAVARGARTPRGRSIIPALTAALTDTSPNVRAAVIQALLTIGPEAVSACDRLSGLLHDFTPRVRAEAAKALYGIRLEVDAPLATLLGLLGDADPEVRIIGCVGLMFMGSDAAPAMPDLKLLLQDPSSIVRERVNAFFSNVDVK